MEIRHKSDGRVLHITSYDVLENNDLRLATLPGADLRNQNLSHSILAMSNLSDADMENAILILSKESKSSG